MNSDQISSSSSSSAASSRCSTPSPDDQRETSVTLINFDSDENTSLVLPSPIVLNVIHSAATPPVARPPIQIDSKIKQLQSTLQHKVQNFDGKRIDPRDEYGQQQTEIKRLVKQFDPLNDSATSPPSRQSPSMPQRHPSIYQHIPNNHVNHILQNLQNNRSAAAAISTATDVALSFDPLAPTPVAELPRTERNGSNLIDFD